MFDSRRRQFVMLAGAAAAAWPLAAFAQVSPRRPLIVWLGSAHLEATPYPAIFLQGMRDLGYVQGRDFDFDYRGTGGNDERLPAVADEVVRLKPDVILTGAVITAVAARKATSTIPIICPALADAIHLGLIASEARPGRNVTGIEPYVAGLPAKQIEIAREVVPGAAKVGLLTNLTDPKAPPQLQELEAAAKALEVKIVRADATRAGDLDGALRALAGERVDVAIILQTSMLLIQGRQIAETALALRIPTVYGYREHVVAGGLISYGVDLRWC